MGLTPPVTSVEAPEARSNWLRVSSKMTFDDLKPTVLTLAMLLLTTSIIC